MSSLDCGFKKKQKEGTKNNINFNDELNKIKLKKENKEELTKQDKLILFVDNYNNERYE